MPINRQILLVSRPDGWATEANFRLVEAPLPAPAAGQFLVRNHWLSLDPYMRGRMDAQKSYAKCAELDEVMVGGAVGEVIASKHPQFAAGDFVVGAFGWQEHALTDGTGVRKVDAGAAPLSCYLGVLGMPGVTAWMGLIDIAQPQAGETVVISAASGAVGSVAGQLAKLAGCRVVGIAGGVAKCAYVVNDLGFDACVDHKAGELYEDLSAAAPKGIDIDFENVGGTVLDTVLGLMNPQGRVTICGLISQYNASESYGMKSLRSILVNRLRMQGFIVTDRLALWPRALEALGRGLADGKIKYRESVAYGLENAPRAFIGMLRGENFGKQLVKLA